jgi:thiol-disulfide isomerase/thioredoxin
VKTGIIIILHICAALLASSLFAQTISGNLKLLVNQPIKLEGFSGLNTYPISKTIIDDKGNFKLSYSKGDYGVGYIMSADQKPFFILLNGEDIAIQGTNFSEKDNLKIILGRENLWFEQYAKEHPRREQALSAWLYLEKIYKADSLFAVQQMPKQAILQEKARIQSEDDAFIAALPKDSYVRWYLPMRKLVSEVSVMAQYRPEEIPGTIAAFRKLDYTNPWLYKSGLFKDAIESHFWLLENSGRPLDSVFTEMKVSIDAMMVQLVMDNQKLTEVTDYVFDLLERHSLFQASEYLALKVLNTTGCTLNSDLAKQLETYRAMKKGNTAPEILFTGDQFAPGYAAGKAPQKLSSLQNKYTLVVFGAGWCPKCKEELPEIAKHYAAWQAQGVEVVFVSLDETKASYEDFVKDFPFISTCDYKKWNGTIVNDYYVFATPTMYLLDANREILLRPNSVKQVDAWVDWYLVQGNRK